MKGLKGLKGLRGWGGERSLVIGGALENLIQKLGSCLKQVFSFGCSIQVGVVWVSKQSTKLCKKFLICNSNNFSPFSYRLNFLYSFGSEREIITRKKILVACLLPQVCLTVRL